MMETQQAPEGQGYLPIGYYQENVIKITVVSPGRLSLDHVLPRPYCFVTPTYFIIYSSVREQNESTIAEWVSDRPMRTYRRVDLEELGMLDRSLLAAVLSLRE